MVTLRSGTTYLNKGYVSTHKYNPYETLGTVSSMDRFLQSVYNMTNVRDELYHFFKMYPELQNDTVHHNLRLLERSTVPFEHHSNEHLLENLELGIQHALKEIMQSVIFIHPFVHTQDIDQCLQSYFDFCKLIDLFEHGFLMMYKIYYAVNNHVRRNKVEKLFDMVLIYLW